MKSPHSLLKAKQKASLLLQGGNLADAWDAFERISRQAPADHETWLNMGAIAAMQGQHERAAVALRRALNLKPDLPQANINMARLLLLRGSMAEALPYLQRYVALQPADVEGYNQLGALLEGLKNSEAAEQLYRRALALGLKSAAIHTGLGRLLLASGEHEAARQQIEEALRLRPEAAMSWFELGRVALEQNRCEEARNCFDRMIALAPDERENYLLSRAFLASHQEYYDEAVGHFRQLLELDPGSVDGHWNYAHLLLLLGRYREGWAEYEWRRHTHFWLGQMWPGEFSQPLWAGEPLAGRTLLVYAEQGFGDTIQFGRYLPLLLARGARVIFHCQPQLLRLFQRMAGIEVVAKDYEAARQTAFDYHTPLMSLPHLLGEEGIPAPIPYIQPDPERLATWRERIGRERFNVGLVWAGSVTNPKDRLRSASLQLFAPLAQLEGVAFHSLQKDKAAEQIGEMKGEWQLSDLGCELHDFDDTAAAIANLDLVITVDSAVAHLAGALGRPVWTLIYFPTEWRWGVAGETTPWYPTMRLFRQSGAEPSWPPVVGRVAHALRDLVAKREAV